MPKFNDERPPMSEAFSFDTRRLVRHLTETGFAENQAEALANEIKDILKNLATKTDIAGLATKAALDNLATKAALKTDLDNLAPKTALDGLATKADLVDMVTTPLVDMVTTADLKAALADMATKAHRRYGHRSDLKADLAQTKYEIIKWMTGIMVGSVVAMSALVVSLINYL